jgi:RHS repeat-associated protein
VEPSAGYTYDAVYRLIEATGREHLGQVGGAPIPHSYNDVPRVGVPHPGDGNAMGTYIERYIYDAVGNFLEMQHVGGDPANPGWTRAYSYNEDSLLESGKKSNRLSSTTIGSTTETYSTNGDGYDAHGSMLRMPQLQIMQWDFKDQLQMTQRQAVNSNDTDGLQHQGERTYYVYDASGQRVRKVTERQNDTRKDERIYLGGFEVYREYDGTGNAVTLERETLHVMNDKQRIVLVETKTITNPTDDSPTQLTRYQFGDHLGSASLEFDDQAQIISYEEYTPYGSTSYQAVSKDIKAAAKRYRYTGKERDEETGLYYHGARYYAPWLGRWTSCDPVRTENRKNAFSYVDDRPINLHDPNGKEEQKPWYQKAGEWIRGASEQVASTAAESREPIPVYASPALAVVSTVHNYAETAKAIKLRYDLYTAGGAETGPSAAVHAVNDVLNPLAASKRASDQAERAEERGDYRTAGAERVKQIKGLVAFAQIVVGAASAAGAATGVGRVGAQAAASEKPPQGPNPSSPGPSPEPGSVPSQGPAPTTLPEAASPTHTPSAPPPNAPQTPSSSPPTARRWRVGDPHDAPTRGGQAPSWDTVRSRYWKNRAASAAEGEFSSENIARMRKGRPPIDPASGKPMELEHIRPQRSGDPQMHRDLLEVTPLEHSFFDRYRRVTDPSGRSFNTNRQTDPRP